MPSVSDLEPSKNIVALAVGNAGGGKTSALASFANKDNPMYVFDIDHRIKGILGSKEWLGDSINYIDFDQFDTRDGFEKVERKFLELYEQHEKRKLKYRTILVESLGSLSEMFLIDSQTKKGLAPNKDFTKLTKDELKGARITGQIAFPTPDDYHYGKRALHILFYHYFMAFTKCNVFLSAWTTDKWGKDPNSDNPYAENIQLPGKVILATNKVANELPGYFDEIYEFTKEESGGKLNPVQFKVKFVSSLAKTCIPKLAKIGSIDITKKNFKQEFDRIVQAQKIESEKVIA